MKPCASPHVCTATYMMILLVCTATAAGEQVFVEAESFADLGGWVVDQQAMDQMGSPYLLAHGLGVPVKDAVTSVTFPTTGQYRVWVRTRDWTRVESDAEPRFASRPPANRGQGDPQRILSRWGPQDARDTIRPTTQAEAPGRFQLLIDGTPLSATLGTEGAEWHWQDGGTVDIKSTQVKLALHDLTGFEGRCDAILFANGPDYRPPEGEALAAQRRSGKPEDAGRFDLVVVGGGMAGTCTAISAGRLGLKVALIQDRPVLGGNNSSEVRVHLNGRANLPPYSRLGDVVMELDPGNRGNARPAAFYNDEKKLRVVQAEPNIRLFLNMHAHKVEKDGNRITAVIARNVRPLNRAHGEGGTPSNRGQDAHDTQGQDALATELRFSAPLFADCTGDGTIGYLAGADYRMGRESREQTGETMAPKEADKMTMGASAQWYSIETEGPSPFPECPWALHFTEESCEHTTRGDWNWETGLNKDQIADFESIRDHAFRAIYGNWAFLKNHSKDKARYANRKLSWVAYIAGKRESRRLLGDVILQQQDIQERREYPDAFVTTTWSIDLHYPDPDNTKHFPGEEFKTICKTPAIRPYPVPYRCLYSRNVENLFMAGRDISVTHVALGTVRVMRTCGMMGELVGMAASICKSRNTTPRGVYVEHLPELKELATRGVGREATRQ
jgi:hypothetical protein